MKSFTSNFFLAFAILILTLGDSAIKAQTFSGYQKIDTLLNLLSTNNKFMGTVAILKNNETVYSSACGLADIEKNIPNTTNTRFRVGSISKMFTSVMTFQLIEEKKLQLDTKLSAFYPAIVNADIITIKDLLVHQSGLWSVTDDSLYLSWNTQPKTHEELLAMIMAQPAVFAPGEKSSYSNTNYLLLGYILETITGKDFATNLQERICKKAGLESTYYGVPTNTANNESYSYSIENAKWVKDNETDMSIPNGAGGVVSTAEDLTTFVNALFNGQLISEGSLSEMIKSEGKYAKGIFRMPFYELQGYGHTGGIDGFRSVLIYYPEEKLGLAICSNGLSYNQNDMIIAVLSIALGKEYKLPEFKNLQITAEQLKKYEGVYSSDDFPIKLTIKLEGQSLTAQGTGQSPFPLEAESETEFSFHAGGIKIAFINDNQLNIKQGAMDLIMTKE